MELGIPLALEVTPDGVVYRVEAPPCEATVDIPYAGVHLSCDRPACHRGIPHRQFLRIDPPHAVGWCGDYCAEPCDALKGRLETLREQGLEVNQTDGRA